MKNRYSHRSRISEAKIRKIVRCFAVDLTALQTAEPTGTNRNTINHPKTIHKPPTRRREAAVAVEDIESEKILGPIPKTGSETGGPVCAGSQLP